MNSNSDTGKEKSSVQNSISRSFSEEDILRDMMKKSGEISSVKLVLREEDFLGVVDVFEIDFK